MATVNSPPCPHCGGTLRGSSATFDMVCRCGFTIDIDVIMAADGRDDAAARLIAAGRWTEPPKADPGIRVSESFSDLAAVMWDPRYAPIGALGDQMRIAAAVEERRHRLDRQPGDAKGAALFVERPARDGVAKSAAQLKRQHMYAIAPLDAVVESVVAMIRGIAVRHGPGRIWHTLAPVHYIADDGQMRIGDVGGVPHVFLRSLYFHDPSCPICGGPGIRVEVGGVTINGCPCVGTNERAIAFDLSKLTKDPASRGYSLSEYVEKAKQLAASKIDPEIFERVRVDTDRAIANLTTHAGRMEAVLMLAQYGTITTEQARELLEIPDVTSTWTERPPTAAVADRAPVYLKSRTENPPGAEFKYSSTFSHSPVDSLDVMHDGWALRDLLEVADAIAQERPVNSRLVLPLPIPMTALQRDAVSAFRSTELRAKIAASKERERRQVTIEVDE